MLMSRQLQSGLKIADSTILERNAQTILSFEHAYFVLSGHALLDTIAFVLFPARSILDIVSYSVKIYSKIHCNCLSIFTIILKSIHNER